MNLDRVNQWLTLIANVGVLAGVFFVAYELQQNRVAIESQTRAEIALSATEDQWNWINFPELTETRIKYQNCEPISQLERNMLGRAIRAEFRRWENTHYQFRQGLYSESEFQGQRNTWQSLMTSSRFVRDWWPNNKQSFSMEFAALIDQLGNSTDAIEECQ